MNIKALMLPGIRAVLSLWKPILLIQVCALIFVVSFYQVPALQTLPQTIDGLKSRFGIGWTLAAVWTSSIVVSEIAAKLTIPGRKWMSWGMMGALLLYYGFIGIVLDYYYLLANHLLGTSTDPLTVAKKMALDQLVFSPLITMPYATTFFAFKDGGFKWNQTKPLLEKGGFWRRYFPILGTCWLFFGPFTLALYNLPTGLQFPMSMAAQAAWSLIVVFVASKDSKL